MFATMRFALMVALIFAGIPSAAFAAATGGPPDTLPDAAHHNQLGVQFFSHGYYDLIPKGRKAEAQQNLDQAEKAFQKAISIKSDFAAAHRNLARLYYLEQRFEEAASHYAQVVRLDPEDLDSYVNLSLAHIELGDYDAAVTCLEEAKAHTSDRKIIGQLDAYIAKIRDRQQPGRN